MIAARSRATGATLFPPGDPLASFGVEQVEGKGPVTEALVVELADVESRAQLARRERAQLLELELPQLVRERLPGIHDVAIDLDDDFVLRHGGVLPEVVNRLLPGPSQRVNPGVQDQPYSAPDLVVKLAESGVRVLIQAYSAPRPFAYRPHPSTYAV